MFLTRILLSDRTGLVGAGGVLLMGLPPAAVFGYLMARLLVPVLLIVLAARGASSAQKIALVRAYIHLTSAQ